MKILLLLLITICFQQANCQTKVCDNIIIVTIDGIRWQEIFSGADSTLLFSAKINTDPKLSQQAFWNPDVTSRRQMLTPFLTSLAFAKGRLYGNRYVQNKMSVENPYRFSYAGYNEIFTGFPDNSVITNRSRNNNNISVLEFLNNDSSYKDSIAVFTAWKKFPFIFNEKRSRLTINSFTQHDENSFKHSGETQSDSVVFAAAQEYIFEHKPKVIHIGFGEADEFAHHRLYDRYLNNIHQVDKMIEALWKSIQSDEHYCNRTIMLITTDHGRGNKTKTWMKHGASVAGSNETWLGIIGCCIDPQQELKSGTEISNAQLAQTIARLLGKNFQANHPVAEPAFFTGSNQ